MDKANGDADRRAFLAKATVGVSTACAVFPLASGVPVILDHLKCLYILKKEWLKF